MNDKKTAQSPEQTAKSLSALAVVLCARPAGEP